APWKSTARQREHDLAGEITANGPDAAAQRDKHGRLKGREGAHAFAFASSEAENPSLGAGEVRRQGHGVPKAWLPEVWVCCRAAQPGAADERIGQVVGQRPAQPRRGGAEGGKRRVKFSALPQLGAAPACQAEEGAGVNLH